jgi:hypothetical protein
VFEIFTFIDNLHLVLCAAVRFQSDEAVKDSNNSSTKEVSGPDTEANSENGNHFRYNIHCTVLRNRKKDQLKKLMKWLKKKQVTLNHEGNVT